MYFRKFFDNGILNYTTRLSLATKKIFERMHVGNFFNEKIFYSTIIFLQMISPTSNSDPSTCLLGQYITSVVFSWFLNPFLSLTLFFQSFRYVINSSSSQKYKFTCIYSKFKIKKQALCMGTRK